MTRSEKLDWERIRTRGRNRFVLYDGILCLGLPFGTVMVALDFLLRLPPNHQAKPLWQLPLEFAFMVCFFGLTMGEFAWWEHERKHFGRTPRVAVAESSKCD